MTTTVVSPVASTPLAAQLDAMNERFFFHEPLSNADRRKHAGSLVARCRAAGGYVTGMPAPTDEDRTQGARLFTGERITSGAAVRHVLGEEALRALRLLEVDRTDVRDALATADGNLLRRINECTESTAAGFFCCGTCTVAMWRYLMAGGLDQAERRIADGMKKLTSMEKDDGTWRRFPFWYTLLGLSEMESRDARRAKRHAAARLERFVKRDAGEDKSRARRRIVAERTLAQI